MEYFRLRADKRIIKPLIPISLPKEYKYHLTFEDFSVMEEAISAYYNYKEEPIWCDFVFRPLLMIYNKVKQALENIIAEENEKLIFLLPDSVKPEDISADMLQALWVPYVEASDFIHEDTVTDGTGLIKKLIIDNQKSEERDILRASLRAEEIWVFSRRAVEAVLAVAPVGALFEPVECR